MIEYLVDISDEMKIVDIAETISKGEYSVKIKKREEDDRLSIALNRMILTLEEITEENKKQDWFSNGHLERDWLDRPHLKKKKF